MSMERWNPFRDLDSMRQAMDRWFDDRLPGSFFNQQGNMMSVALDVRETDQGYELEASMPGVRPEDLDITVDRDTVTLRGQSQSNEERKEGKNYIYRERRSGSFFRTIRLPEPIDADHVEANLDHGVLRVTLPRLSQTANRRVQVRSGQGTSASQIGTPRTNETSTGYTAAEAGSTSAASGNTGTGSGSTSGSYTGGMAERTTGGMSTGSGSTGSSMGSQYGNTSGTSYNTGSSGSSGSATSGTSYGSGSSGSTGSSTPGTSYGSGSSGNMSDQSNQPYNNPSSGS
ncbi:MAG TPA: Hsp20/alpha crystallin family protein [Chloroflexia bacterium]|nr:Hsp20/alpha crystallin family protein [Chloroflexia bacterium]